MNRDLSFLLVTPHALRKGLSGVILSRLLSRTGLELAAAKIMAADEAFAKDFADALAPFHTCPCQPEYIRTRFVPVNGRSRAFLALLLKGPSAVEKVAEAAGRLALTEGAGVTIRDAFAEVVRDETGKIIFFEPAVIVPESQAEADALLPKLAKLAAETPNIVEKSDAADGSGERTLVILKPENWRRPGVRPGAIMDIFTRTGLALVGCKVHHIPLADALEFYGPVQFALRSKLAPKIAEKAKACLEEKFSVRLRPESDKLLLDSIGTDYADDQFFQIVEFMSGVKPCECPADQRTAPGKAQCMVLIFEGRDAVSRIRTVLGPTDPSKAPGGTVRGEFGTNVMVNSAHASDSQESFVREAGILRVQENEFASLISK